MTPHVVWPAQAISALDFMLGWAGGHMPVDVERNGQVDRFWHACEPGSGPRLAKRVLSLDERLSPEIRFGLPRVGVDSGGVSYATVLWAVVEGKLQVRCAANHQPLPSMVLRLGEGSRRILLWPLDERLGYYDAKQMNRRLAYRFHAVQKLGDPDELRIPAPGCCLRVGRKRPVMVRVSRFVANTFTARDVAGRLKDPPDIDLREVIAARAGGST